MLDEVKARGCSLLISPLFTRSAVCKITSQVCLAICSQEQDFGVEVSSKLWLVLWLQDYYDGSGDAFALRMVLVLILQQF
jgi:hypothetical protein